MKKHFALFSAMLVAVLYVGVNLHAQQSPTGLWKTIDDETNKAKSYVKVWERNGKYYGTIVRLIGEPNGGKDKVCTECTGRFKGKKIVGMTFMWGLKHESGNDYGGGRIMDPGNGKTYRCLMELQNGGKKLRVRGYIGFSFAGRNQYWYRMK